MAGTPAPVTQCSPAATSPLSASLVSCQLDSGRTHQVRVHLAAIGHAVVADERYSAARQLAAARAALPELRRPWLHAAQLGFAHPVTGLPMRFESALPDDLSEALGQLRLDGPGRPGDGRDG